MKSKTAILITAVLLLWGLLAPVRTLQAQTPEQIRKIENAAPTKASATPKKVRKLLVVSIAKGFKHKSIPYAAKAIEIMGKKTGAYQVTNAKDLNVFADWNTLKQFDAVLFNNTTKLQFDNQKWRKNLLKFVKSGKGVIGIHAATDNFYTWPEGAALIGGLFDGHPWVSRGTWKIKLDEPDHPLNKAFGGKGFEISDEIYRIKDFSREYHRVLVSLDMTDPVNLSAKGVRQTDKDLPISWINKYGKGRVFYCSFGHNLPIYWNPSILQHYLDGIQYALGDYAVDDTPSVTKYLENIRKYQWGESRASLTMLSDFVRWAMDHPDALKRTEKNLLQVLKDKNASLPGKQFICRELSLIGTDESVSTLAKMLKKDATADMSLYALERIPGQKVNKELLKAAKKSKGRVKVGVINSLGVRKVAAAVSQLKKWVEDPNGEIAMASASALGKIGGPQAEEVLAGAAGKSSGKLKAVISDARLTVAEGYLKSGKTAAAKSIYTQLFVAGQSVAVRSAALRGLISAEPNNSAAKVVEVLKSGDADMQAAVLSLMPGLPKSQPVTEIAAQLSTLEPMTQIQLLTALSERGDRAARPAVLRALKSSDDQVRVAALKALKNLGTSQDVELLADQAANSRGDERSAARQSLALLNAPGVDKTVLNTISNAPPEVKVELINSAGDRGINSAVDLLLKTAADTNSRVETASLKSLAVLAKPGKLPALIDLLIKAPAENVRKEAERTVYTVSQKIPPKGGKAEAILTVLPTVKNPVARGSLLQVLGRIGDRKALGLLRKSLASKNVEIKTAAIRALSNWPTSEPLGDLLQVARTSKDQVQQVLALRGYIKLIDINHNRPASYSLGMYKTAMELATSTNEKRMALSGLANVSCVGAMKYALGFLGDPALNGEAQVAVVGIAREIYRAFPEECKSAMKKILQGSPTDSVKRNANRVLEGISQL